MLGVGHDKAQGPPARSSTVSLLNGGDLPIENKRLMPVAQRLPPEGLRPRVCFAPPSALSDLRYCEDGAREMFADWMGHLDAGRIGRKADG